MSATTRGDRKTTGGPVVRVRGAWLRPLAALLFLAGLAGLGGCGPRYARLKFPPLMSESDCAVRLVDALQAESPVDRREAIDQISDSPHRAKSVVVRALGLVARTDPSESVRFAAVRALARSDAPEAVGPLLEIMRIPDQPVVRWETRCGEICAVAVDGLDRLSAADRLTDTQHTRCQTKGIELLERHPARDVRVAAARLLRRFRSITVLNALIAALEQRDFGVVYEGERSLAHLTGRSFDYDAAAWREWLASAEDPFAHAGTVEQQPASDERDWWARTVQATRRVFRSFGRR